MPTKSNSATTSASPTKPTTTEHSNSIVFTFSTPFDPGAYRLIQIPSELAEYYSSPQTTTTQNDGFGGSDNKDAPTLIIKGLETDEAVMCSPSKTYALRQVNTSNTTFVAAPTITPSQPNLDRDGDLDLDSEERTSSDGEGGVPGYEILDCISSYIELVPCAPRTDRLNDLLGETVYGGAEEERRLKKRGGEVKFYTMEDLRMTVQASDEELRAALKRIHAVEIEGCVRLINTEYQQWLLEMIILCAIEADKNMECLSFTETVAMLAEQQEDQGYPGVPETVVFKVLEAFSDAVDDQSQRTCDYVFQLSPFRIGRFFAKRLLSSSPGRRWRLNEFLEEWTRKVPDPFGISMNMLEGLCLVESEIGTDEPSIRYFPRSAVILSSSSNSSSGGSGSGSSGGGSASTAQITKRRFDILFKERRKWTYEEILPYVYDVVGLPDDILGFCGTIGTSSSSSSGSSQQQQQQKGKGKEGKSGFDPASSETAGALKKLDAVLIKYARVSKVGTRKFYTSRLMPVD
ncbi:hypothetical protein HK102_000221 [Quaeritorhiza haematococci]|nr:hypothetical protein HK102_000221 [Quaeritorhiza haematococci]